MAQATTARQRGGFSFTEVVIVLAILAIVGTTSVSYVLEARPHAQLESAELSLAAKLGEYRYQALSEETPIRVVLNGEDGTWQVEKLVEGNWTAAGAPGQLSEGCSFAPDGISFPDATIEFTTRGSLMASGDVTVMSSQGETRTLTGNLATGRFVITEGNLR